MKRILLAGLSGLLYALSFPPCDLYYLAWVCLVPLFIAIQGVSGKKAFFMGLVSGIVAWAGIIYWIACVMYFHGGLGIFLSCLVLFALICYLSLYFGVFAFFSSVMLCRRHAWITLSGIWIMLEMIRTYALSGFPWALIGYSQASFCTFIQTAETGGVYLTGAFIVMVNVSLGMIWKKGGHARQWRPLVCSMCLVLAVSLWGQWRMDILDPGNESIRVGVAQANILQEEKWLPEMIEPTIDIYSRLTKEACREGASLVVWPETACTFYLFGQGRPTSRIIDLNKGVDCQILAGSPAIEEGKYFNRTWLLDAGRVQGHYDKIHLVPFGEYLPFPDIFGRFFGKMVKEVSDFSKGEDLSPIDGMGILNCFEIIMPYMSRGLTREGADILVNVSNDAWFRSWPTSEQLLEMSVFRAVENRRWVVRSVNHGISAFIDPFGRVARRMGRSNEGFMVEDINRGEYQGIYTRYGPIIPFAWALLGCVAALTCMKKRC
ncbi:MAG: apolipoprotein N-acyltransferase [Thermodesulfobacteriota bacterium]|nr:apolipoprotein N-acyltransferase [Thermodesulfobacteriota bacterium]